MFRVVSTDGTKYVIKFFVNLSVNCDTSNIMYTEIHFKEKNAIFEDRRTLI